MQKVQNVALSSIQTTLDDLPPAASLLELMHYYFPGKEYREEIASTPFPGGGYPW